MARAAIAGALLFLAGAMVPLIGPMAMLLTPVPMMLYVVGLPGSWWRTAAVFGLTAALIGIGGGQAAAGAYAITFGLGSATMVYMLERRHPFEPIVLCTAGAMVAAGTLVALIVTGSPALLAVAMHRDLMTAMEHGEKFYHSIGIEAGLASDVRTEVVDAALRLSPALAVLSAAFTVLIDLGVFWRISGRQQRLGYMVFGDLARWSTPDWLIWVLIVAGFGLFIPIPQLATIALDGFVCVAAVYFCQGLAIMSFYFKVLTMPPLARGLIYFVTIVQPVLAALVCAAGVFDLWIDFRRLKPPSQEARNFGDFL